MSEQPKRGFRIALPLAILVAGLAAASLFRRPPPLPSEAQMSEGGLLRQPASVGPRSAASLDSPPMHIEAERPSDASPATILAPESTHPPTLPKSYPYAESQSSRWGNSMGMRLPGVGRAGTAGWTHRIVDGDTLPALARHYYGDAKRAQEIFEANRDLLQSPEVLPIGRPLKIPAAGAPSPRAP